jgi:hypothetical protein
MGCPRKLRGEDMTKKELAETVKFKIEFMLMMMRVGREEEAERELQEAMNALNDAIEEDEEWTTKLRKSFRNYGKQEKRSQCNTHMVAHTIEDQRIDFIIATTAHTGGPKEPARGTRYRVRWWLRPRLRSICGGGVKKTIERTGANVGNNVEEDM